MVRGLRFVDQQDEVFAGSEVLCGDSEDGLQMTWARLVVRHPFSRGLCIREKSELCRVCSLPYVDDEWYTSLVTASETV